MHIQLVWLQENALWATGYFGPFELVSDRILGYPLRNQKGSYVPTLDSVYGAGCPTWGCRTRLVNVLFTMYLWHKYPPVLSGGEDVPNNL